MRTNQNIIIPELEEAWGKAHPKSPPIAPREIEWSKPKPLPSGLAPVEAYKSEFAPNKLASWIDDIANRLQCPPDYVAVAALTALGAVIGRRIGISPQGKTDWVVVPNVWGAFIGSPGMLKSPAMQEALKPLRHLEAEAAKENEIAQEAYKAGISTWKLKREVRRELEKATMKGGEGSTKASETLKKLELGDEPKEPAPLRYRTNDSSYEALGELLIGNPSGILLERDELVSLLKHLDHDNQANARGFYLSGWSGMDPYTFDRIVRGHRHIEAVCISVLGNTQPTRMAEYVRRANADGGGGDGLIQRFGLLVYPDQSPDWRDVDEYPNPRAREKAREVFYRMSQIDDAVAFELGAMKGDYDRVPYLRFDEGARTEFLDWRGNLECRLRSKEFAPALEGHLAKYRKLVPALALMNHLADDGTGPVSQAALLKALACAHYLESHARRVYGSHNAIELAAAKAILDHIRKGDINDGFTARDVQRHQWSNLTERGHIQAGLNLLVDLDYLAASSPTTTPRGGHPKIIYHINPEILR